MHMVLLLVGALSGAVGMLMLAYGAANNTAAIGNTLIIAGMTAVVGGLIVIGLAAVVSRLRRLTEALDRQPLPRIAGERFDAGQFEPKRRAPVAPMPTPAPSVLPPETAPPIATGEAGESATAAPDMHQGVGRDATPAAASSAAVTEPAPEAQPRTARADVQAEVRPELEWPHVSPAEPDVHQAQESSAEGTDRLGERYRPVIPPSPSFEQVPPTLAEPAVPPAPPIILKSGVLDGMAYTLYSDGSIEAELREGTMRFRSIPELRAYIFEHPR